MIVREFLHNPEMPFDFRNDYYDTLRYLRNCAVRTPCDSKLKNLQMQADEAIIRLQERWEDWVRSRWHQFSRPPSPAESNSTPAEH